MISTVFGQLCMVVLCMFTTIIHDRNPSVPNSESIIVTTLEPLLLSPAQNEQQSKEEISLVERNRTTRLRNFAEALASSSKDQESLLLRRINDFANEVESFSDESVNLLRTISDAAYNKNMSELFIATQGLLIDYDLSIYNLEKAKEKRAFLLSQRFIPSSNDSLNIELDLDIMDVWVRESAGQKSIELGQKLETKSLSIWQKLRLDILLGQAFVESGNLSTGLNYYLSALELSKAESFDKDEETEVLILNDIALTLEQLEDYTKAQDYFDQALEIAYDTGLEKLQMVVLSNMGVLYKNQQFYEDALVSYKSALVLAEKSGDEYVITQNKFNIGNIFTEKLQYDSAMVYYKEVEEVVIQWDSKQEHVFVLIMQAVVNIELERYLEAENRLMLALDIQKQLDNPYIKLEVYSLLSRLYVEKESFKEALSYRDLEFSLRDSLNFQQQASEVKTKIDDYEQAQIELQRSLDAEKKRARNAKILGVSLLLILASVSFVIIFALERKKKKVESDLFLTTLKLAELNADEVKRSVVEVYFGKPSVRVIRQNTQFWELFNQIMDSMIVEKWYRNPELSLTDLTTQVRSNTKYVSTSIKLFTGLNFSNFVNTFRIQEAKERMLSDKFTMTMEELMLECGFQNRGTFYRAFNTVVGMTPKEFRKRVVSEREIV